MCQDWPLTNLLYLIWEICPYFCPPIIAQVNKYSIWVWNQLSPFDKGPLCAPGGLVLAPPSRMDMDMKRRFPGGKIPPGENLPAMQETQVGYPGLEDTLEEETTPAVLPGESHGQRNPAGYSP